MYDVITIGSAVVDAFVKSRAFTLIKSDKFSTGVGECFAFGSKIEVDKLVLATGGGATNAATTFARLGFKTACAARVGTDFLADNVRDDLVREKVAENFLLSCSKHHTGFSVLLLGGEGERTVLVYRGASEHCQDGQFLWSKMRAKWFYVSSFGGHLDLFKRILAHAKKIGARVAWNPGGLELAHGPRVLTPFLAGSDIIFLNKEEAALVPTASTQAKIAVISDGPRGAEVFAHGRRLSVRATGVKAISRTGAGDAFGSGTVAGLARKFPLEKALQLGVANAESVIRHIGAKTGILRRVPSSVKLKQIKVTSKNASPSRGEAGRGIILV